MHNTDLEIGDRIYCINELLDDLDPDTYRYEEIHWHLTRYRELLMRLSNLFRESKNDEEL